MQQIKSKKANTSLKVISKADFIKVANTLISQNDGEGALIDEQIKMFEPLLLLSLISGSPLLHCSEFSASESPHVSQAGFGMFGRNSLCDPAWPGLAGWLFVLL